MATNATETYAQTGSSTRVVQRRWVRRDRPIWPFVWRGLLPLIGLLFLLAYALVPFARDEMESTVLRETRAQLDSQGYTWATLAVSGQNVIVGGLQPAPGDGDAALAAARAATCPSWAGRLTCAVIVSGAFSDPPAAPVAMASPRPESKPEAMPEPKPEPQPAAPAAAAVQACQESLADVVAQSKIEFAVSSATIDPKSAALLDALARAAGQCPGVIRVEGHTDATGDAAANRALSEARAQSVVSALAARGIPPERLKAQGFGADRPLADNTSAAGRAHNRRIEFRVLAAN